MTKNLETLGKILQNDQFRYLYLAGLISSDTNITDDDCNENLNNLNYIKDNINNLNLNNELKDEVIKLVNDGIEILERDIKNILN
jgi:hypothetical protein